MKKIVKRICLIGLTLLSSLSFAFGLSGAQKTEVIAASSLETEFTNDGQFSVGSYSNVAWAYADGASEGLPTGYIGTVLKIAASSGTAYASIDFSASKIWAKAVDSIVVRAYSPDYTSADEFRTTSSTNALEQYGAGAHDMSTWCDITLNATSMSHMTDANGYLTSIFLGLRDKGTISQYFYIDSITVNMKSTTKVTFNQINAWWNNNSYDNANCTFLMFDGGISGNGNLDAAFGDLLSKMTLNGAAVDKSNFSFYCPNWIGSSGGIVMRIATNPAAGSVLTLPAGAIFNIGGTDTNLYEIEEEVSLQFNGTSWAVYEEPAEAELAVFQGPWGNADVFNSSAEVLLQYSSAATWDYANKGDFASKVTYKNSKTGVAYQVTDNDIVGWEGQRWIRLRNLSGYDVIEIAEGGRFGGDIEIPALTLYQVNGRWVTTALQAPTANYTGFASGWNNLLSNGAGNTILNFDVTLGAATNATNLAAKVNRTSLMVKYNGKTFADLYADANNANAKKYSISYAHSANHFYFAVPEADLVEGATLEIEEGTPFMNHYLPALTFVYTNGAWVQEVEINYTPNYVSIGLVNNLENGDYWGLSLFYDTTGFAAAGTQVMAKSYTGITVNNELLAPALWGGDQILFWIPKAKCVAGYNGYSHATLVIKEGATVTNEKDEVFTLGGVTLYLVDGKWTETIPADYEIVVNIPELGTPDCVYSGFGTWNNNAGMTLFEFTNFVNKPTTTNSYLSSTGYYIELNGTKLTEVPGANIYTWENMYWLRVDIPNVAEGSILTIPEGTPFAGNYLPKLVFKLVDGIWCQAFTVDIEIDGESHVIYSQNDVPVVIDDEYFENYLAENSIPGKAISFTVRGVTYPAGTTFKALTDTHITVQTVGFSTTEGASIRVKTPTGIRFETKINKADYDKLVALYGESNIELGTYIMPRSLLVDADFRSYFADGAKIDGTDYVQIINNGFANKETVDTDGYYLYYGSLVKLQPNNYSTDFFGIGYIKITDGENVYTVFGGYNLDKYTRSIYYVASKAYNDYDNGTTAKSALKSYLDGVVYIADEAKISSVMEVEGYTSPYSISYNAQTGTYTVTGNAEIKSVMFGDKKRVSTRTSTLEVGGVLYYVTDYNLNATAENSTLTFKLSPVADASELVDFTLEVPSNQGVKILQITDTELTDSSQMRTSNALSSSQKAAYARKNVYVNCFNYITELVEHENPDLIILTGDIVNGSFDDNGTMWLRIIEFMDSLGIPWAPVFGEMDNDSAMGTSWQREQLVLSQNCLFKAGTATGNGDYTIGITDNGVLRRIIYMFNGSAGIVDAQVNWMKGVAAGIEVAYGTLPAFAFLGQDVGTNFTSDFAAANIDGVFMGNNPESNAMTTVDGIRYTYGTKTGVYGDYDESKLGGTWITVTADGGAFTIEAECLVKSEMENKDVIPFVETYDGSSVVTDAYLAPIWDTNKIYDETGLFVGETGSVTLMYTPTDPKDVVVRDITLGVTYTYGLDYTISGNKVTRVAGGNLPYMPFDEYYMTSPAVYNGKEQGWQVTLKNGKTEDGYSFSGTRYMYYNEAYEGNSHHVTFTYSKTEAWTGTTISGDTKAESFIEKLKTDKAATVLFYGDSITVGCNASGTPYGGMRNPFLPAWTDLVVSSLEKTYAATISKYNAAVGGWTTGQGAENLTTKVTEAGTSLAAVDLFVIAFGMNDPATAEADYIASIKQMINAYYAANPNGSVLLVSPMQPNTQSSMVSGNQSKWENALNSVKNSNEYRAKNISLARVFTIFSELLSVSGKLSRDYLGNNINHPNDFGVRIYAQVILKTLCGDDFN